MNNTENTEKISTTEVNGNSIPTSSALLPGVTIPLQVSTKTVRSNSDVYIDPTHLKSVHHNKNLLV